MGEKLLNSFISAVFGAISAVGVVWYLQEAPTASAPADTAADPAAAAGPAASFDELEVKRLKVTDCVMVFDTAGNEPAIELRGGSIVAKKSVLSDRVGAFQMVGQKLQITGGDPAHNDGEVFGELATNEEGGAYFALLSPRGTHSINMGFDKKETGFIISQNNLNSAMVAQAILPLPDANEAAADPLDGTLPTSSTPAPAPLTGTSADSGLSNTWPSAEPSDSFPALPTPQTSYGAPRHDDSFLTVAPANGSVPSDDAPAAENASAILSVPPMPQSNASSVILSPSDLSLSEKKIPAKPDNMF